VGADGRTAMACTLLSVAYTLPVDPVVYDLVEVRW
jgi:hypothetical protein